MKKIKPWVWIALAVGGFLVFRHLRHKRKEILKIDEGRVEFEVPQVSF